MGSIDLTAPGVIAALVAALVFAVRMTVVSLPFTVAVRVPCAVTVASDPVIISPTPPTVSAAPLAREKVSPVDVERSRYACGHKPKFLLGVTSNQSRIFLMYLNLREVGQLKM